MADIVAMKVWKKGATVAERFEEMAHYARQHPEKFKQIVIGWTWDSPDKCQRFTDWVSAGCETSMEVAGVVALLQMEVHEHIHGRSK